MIQIISVLVESMVQSDSPLDSKDTKNIIRSTVVFVLNISLLAYCVIIYVKDQKLLIRFIFLNYCKCFTKINLYFEKEMLKEKNAKKRWVAI